MRWWTRRAKHDPSITDERDRSVTDGLTRFLRDHPGALVDEPTPAPKEPVRSTFWRDLLISCLIVGVAVALLHFATPIGAIDTISNLIRAIELGDWAGAALDGIVVVVCLALLVPLPYVLLRAIRGRP
jgi:hypothetical protein